MRADNPVHGVIRFADGMKERRLSDAEYEALGKAIREAEAADYWPYAVEATVRARWSLGQLQNSWSEL